MAMTIEYLETEMQECLDLLPITERNFLQNWLLNLNSSSTKIVPANFDSVTQLLQCHIYPVLQILSLNRDKCKLQIDRVILEVLQLLLKEDDAKNRDSFINFIVNFPLNILNAPALRLKLTKLLTKDIESSDDICLALLARHDSNLLVEVLEQSQEKWQICSTGVPSKEFILQQALRNKLHFAPLTARQLKNASSISNNGLRNNLLILKIADELSNTKQALSELGNINKWLGDYSIDETPAHLQEIHKFFYADFQRIALIVDFLKRYAEIYKGITLDAILNGRCVLKLLYDHDIDASFDDTRRLLDATRKWQIQLTNMKCFYELEMETLNYYTALSTVCDIMLPSPNICEFVAYCDSKIQQLNGMLRKILNVDMLCALIEDIFQLIFLRWEHLRHSSGTHFSASHANRSFSAANSTGVSSTAEIAVETPTASMRSTPHSVESSGRHGFICNGQALYAIFVFLKNFITKKIHSEDYKLASERVQLRFQRIIDVITEALWKYGVLQKFDNSVNLVNTSRKFGLEVKELLRLVHIHPDTMEKTSSDDDSRDRSNQSNLTRRKASRKKRRATISGAAGITRSVVDRNDRVETANAHVMTCSVNAAGDIEDNAVEELKSRRDYIRLSERSIIPQMLGSPENLAIMALSLKNFDDVKFIIENFHLQNTALNRELTFVEQQQQIKQKLATIYKHYLQKESSGDSGSADVEQPKATVEQIRNVAGKGFDISRILSVIDTFALTQRIQPTMEQQQLCERYVNNPQYAFLRNFEAPNLNAFIITDLVLNLPFNREITANVVAIIRRQQQLASAGSMSHSLRSDDSAGTTNKMSDIGALSLLESLSECLLLLPQYCLSQLLTDNYYTLKPRKLALMLQRERAFNAVFSKAANEVGHIDDLKTHASLFHDLQAKCNYYQRFVAYVQYLAQLVQLRDRNLVYHTSALLRINVCDVIGELIFECNMTPLEIEANVAALNLNLVHVIALNVCPEIAGRCGGGAAVGKGDWRKITKQKAESILNYVANQNSLLACLLQGVINTVAGVPPTANNTLNTNFLQSLLELEEIERVAPLFKGNKFVAALRSDYDPSSLVAVADSKLTQLELLSLDLGYQPKVLQQTRTDQLLVQLIEEDARNIRYAGRIHDVGVRAKLIQANFTKIATTRLAKELIENTLQNRQATKRIPTALRAQLEGILADITIYAKVSEVLQFETWPQAYDFGMKTPTAIFEKLLQSHLYKLCYNWCRVVKLTQHFAAQKQRFLDVLLQALLELHDDLSDTGSGCNGDDDGEVNKYLLQILETFPTRDVVNFLDTHKDKFRTVRLMRYTVAYLMRHNPTECQSYRNYKISLVIFEQLTTGELAPFWKLFKHPLLIIEQLIMNTKFETLTKVLAAVRAALAPTDTSAAQVCTFCFDKRGHIYDIHTRSSGTPHKVKFQLGADIGSTTNSAFILLNFNLYQKNHATTNECIDLLLRIYGTKALDYHVSDIASSSERVSQTTDMQQSLDSLCGAFQMPNVAPTREDWVRDDDATHCMCCHRAAFTMLMRRHHCRRCGRVVCFACSAHRMRIPDLYEDVEVRVCNDCFSKTEEAQRKRAQNADAQTRETNANSGDVSARGNDAYKWQLCGNITHDKLLREEFCYEHAPSVALCLSILAFHQGQQKCVDLLLYHCHKLEKLFVPNPEVDYELVAKMMNCLALAAKVRGGPPEIETIREHSMIIMSVVQNGCESLIPPGPLNNHSLRKLGDSLVQAEKWDLAFEVHLKCGFPTVGVMAAHGLSCLRAGCFDTAREKFSYCMTKLSSEFMNEKICKYIMSTTTIATTPDTDTNDNPFEYAHEQDIQTTKRPQRGPPLLQEIIKTIESTPCMKPQPETLKRASLIRSSNTSLASLLSRRKDVCPIRMHEPALGILNTLANLKHIAKGQYSELHSNFSGTHANLDNRSRQYVQHTRGFEECLYYVLTYGSHTDVLQFLMRHHELNAALKYFLQQSLDSEFFIHNIFLVSLRYGNLPTLIGQLQKLDASLGTWRVTLLQTCHYLETQNLLNSLYQLQMLLQDPVRASMTCVRFYSANCENFQHLHANAMHLHNAQQHLQTQLEQTQWEKVNLESMVRSNRRSSVGSRRSSMGSGTNTPTAANFLMQMDARALNSHINTISMQLEVAKFLAQCERELSAADEVNTLRTLKQLRLDNSGKSKLPTLFDGAQERIQVCILILLCGKNIDEGFGLAYRIIHHYKLPEVKVFGATAKFLACNQRITEVEKLLSCITSNNGTQTRDIDEILSVAINSACNCNEPEVKSALDNLVKRIHSVELRISCHIFIGQLKSAYLLANKYERIGDIRRIQRQADLTNQVHIKKLCERKLFANAAARE